MTNQPSEAQLNDQEGRELVLNIHVRKAAQDAVVEAMIEHGPDGHIDGYQQITDAALNAAAPHLRAQALREAATELLSDESAAPKSFKEMYNAIYAAWLQERADQIGAAK